MESPWTQRASSLQELEHLGVGFVSLTEDLGPITPAGRAMAGLLFAELEREILRERTLADPQSTSKRRHGALQPSRAARPEAVPRAPCGALLPPALFYCSDTRLFGPCTNTKPGLVPMTISSSPRGAMNISNVSPSEGTV